MGGDRAWGSRHRLGGIAPLRQSYPALSWSVEFDDPIELPDGPKLLTLRDAAEYVTKLPKAEHVAPSGRQRWKR